MTAPFFPVFSFLVTVALPAVPARNSETAGGVIPMEPGPFLAQAVFRIGGLPIFDVPGIEVVGIQRTEATPSVGFPEAAVSA